MKKEKITKQIDFENIITSSLNELTLEANELFKLLDKTSAAIRNLENSLQNIKIHFPFRFKIDHHKSSQPIYILKDGHKNIYPETEGYHIITNWFLVWDLDDKFKNYRLILLAEEIEVLFHGFEDCYREYKLSPNQIFKKPFIETDLKTRLQYAECLAPFINSFKQYLQNYRISIEGFIFSDL